MTDKAEKNLMNAAIEKMEYMVRIMDDKDNVVYMNRKMRDRFGDITGRKCFEMMCQNGKCDHCVTADCQRSGKAETKDICMDGRYYKVIASPVTIHNNDSESKKDHFSIELFHDITEQKKMEQKIFESYEKMKADISFAKQVQYRVLPIDGEYWNSMRLASSYVPSEELGGDLFDLVKLNEEECLFYVADVSGHGVRSSLLTIFLRQLIRGLRSDGGNLTKLVNELLENYRELNIGEEQYFTILCGVYNKTDRLITLINAGHNCLPILIRCDGQIEEISVTGMPICSLLKKANQQTVTVKVEKGDRIVLYTDGITEAYDIKSGQFFGTERLIESARNHLESTGKSLAEGLIESAKEFSCKSLIDDAAAIVLEIL